MNFGLAFSYVFKDEEWFKKVALPALCSLIPVVGAFITLGWSLKATKNVVDGNEEHALPDLEFGADLGLGFMAYLIIFIYCLPPAILWGITSGLFSYGGEFDEVVQIIFYILGGCIGLLGVLLSILIAFMCMAGLANYVVKGKFGAAFQFKEIFGMLKKSFVSWLLVVVGQILAVGIIGPLGSIVCVIGAALTMAYGNAVVAHLMGQAYNQSAEPLMGDVETL